MKITVDFDLCQGHGMCQEEAGDVFQVSDAGELTVLQEEPPEALWAAVREAAQYCPTGAIELAE